MDCVDLVQELARASRVREDRFQQMQVQARPEIEISTTVGVTRSPKTGCEKAEQWIKDPTRV